jgi:hypothetical protein
MIHLLPLSLAGALLVGWQQQRRPKQRLIDTLASSTDLTTPVQQSVARLTQQPEQNLALSAGLLGLTTIDHLGMPVLRWIALPGLCYLDGYFIHTAYLEWQAERRVGMATSDAVLAAGLLVTRQWGANSLFATLFFTSHTLHAKSLQQLVMADNGPTLAAPALSLSENVDAVNRNAPLQQPKQQARAPKAQWQTLLDQGALPLLTLSAVSMPWLGAKRSLAVLLTNFGYDYRITAPITTLSYLATARQQGIWLRNGQTLETLQRLDVLIIDAEWAATDDAPWQPDLTLTLIRREHTSVDLDALIAEQQAAGHIVAYLGQERPHALIDARPDLWITASATPDADIRLAADQPAQLQALLALRTVLTANRKRGLYLALAPSLISLSGIYFLRFGVVTTLLVDYGGTAAGMLNALAPRLRSPRLLTAKAEIST